MTSRVGKRRVLAFMAAALTLGVGAAQAGQLPGMGELSGMVKAPKAFTAAKVYAFNKDRQIKYMVFTEK